jgi:hypothetical protein
VSLPSLYQIHSILLLDRTFHHAGSALHPPGNHLTGAAL